MGTTGAFQFQMITGAVFLNAGTFILSRGGINPTTLVPLNPRQIG
jgi:hypothetical protein